ncbi:MULTISPECIES: DUF3397 domain-containing protein [Enterococcus]|uniref:Lipoprotein n=1 Tax=Enterococcus sulfureus ATCC 49903 TaxID=1140003 RepID=S0LDJ0_9ENTE|nr:DUF3397 domain-containing protein [Enterococcus sulfureus]EOT51375.1 hypothetical protein OMY_00088 [Enterococcus sulfureus ATCC 49903]EOT87032.1 hypothetical protein I573_00087 [Enterococcus sulfureus ATCC 49903]
MITFTISLLFWYLFPIIALFGAQFIVTFFQLKRKFNLKAPDIATFFLIFGFHQLSLEVLGTTLLAYYFMSIILLAIGLAFVHAYFFDEINYQRFFKMYWRMVFLFTLFIYILLIIVSLIGLII